MNAHPHHYRKNKTFNFLTFALSGIMGVCVSNSVPAANLITTVRKAADEQSICPSSNRPVLSDALHEESGEYLDWDELGIDYHHPDCSGSTSLVEEELQRPYNAWIQSCKQQNRTTPEEPPPPAPHTNLLDMDQCSLLLSGYIRSHCGTNQIPDDIITLCATFWRIHGGVSYRDALSELMNGECSLRVYDFKLKQWRTALFCKQFERTQRIMVRYTANMVECDSDRVVMLKDFPINYIKSGNATNVTYRELSKSDLPRENIEEWRRRRRRAV